MKTIALFKDNSSKEAEECGDGIMVALSPHFKIKPFNQEECLPETFKDVDLIAFPGGVGDADDYDGLFLRKRANAVAEFVKNGGAYLGICVGAYWAGKHYFDILDGVDAVQYIKRPNADIRRSYNKAAHVVWNGQPERMFFRDGCAFLGNENNFNTIGRYFNGDPMCIMQGKIGIMGACPDSLESWYSSHSWMRGHYHGGQHHQLLLEFVDKLLH